MHGLCLWITWPQKMQRINSKHPDFPLVALLMYIVVNPCVFSCYSFLRDCELCCDMHVHISVGHRGGVMMGLYYQRKAMK